MGMTTNLVLEQSILTLTPVHRRRGWAGHLPNPMAGQRRKPTAAGEATRYEGQREGTRIRTESIWARARR